MLTYVLFEMGVHVSPVMRKIIKLIGVHKNNEKIIQI
jgi:hypothetical protein